MFNSRDRKVDREMLKAKYDITDLTEKCRLMPKRKILELGSHVLLNLGAYSFILEHQINVNFEVRDFKFIKGEMNKSISDTRTAYLFPTNIHIYRSLLKCM